MITSLPFFGTLPLQATDIALKHDKLYIFLVVISIFFCVLVFGAMIYFAVNYRKSVRAKADYIPGNHLLELIWTVIPTILVMVIFVWGYMVYKDMVYAPSEAIEVRAIGKQWLWQFQYENGRTEINKLFVPLGKPVKVVMTSDDVLHSLFIPAFRVKKDVVPGMYTQIWFEAKVPGEHHLFCAEYCGTSHSGMIGKVVVLGEDDWKQFMKGKEFKLASAATTATDAVSSTASAPMKTVSLAERGKMLSQVKGCVACHSDSGAPGVGPSYKGLYGSNVLFTDGKQAKADDNYIRESIENPQAHIVKGFNPVMPTFKGLLNEEEMNAVIAYVKSVK